MCRIKTLWLALRSFLASALQGSMPGDVVCMCLWCAVLQKLRFSHNLLMLACTTASGNTMLYPAGWYAQLVAMWRYKRCKHTHPPFSVLIALACI